MDKNENQSIERRSFLAGSAALGASVLTGGVPPFASETQGEMPKRVLGRTGVEVPIVGFGGGLFGRTDMSAKEAATLLNQTLDAGVTYLDAAPIYPRAEELMGQVVPHRRDEIFLVTKVRTPSAKEAEEYFTNSLKLMKTDHVDLLHIHNMGLWEVDDVMADDGVFGFVTKMKKEGRARFIGITSHLKHEKLLPVLETGQLDVTMLPLGMLHKYAYKFEEVILPVARKHKMGIVGMKVFGGPTGDISKHVPGRVPREHLQNTVRYCLSLEGVATAVLGAYTIEEVRQNAAWARAYKPFSASEVKVVDAGCKQMAAEFGAYLGAV